MIDKKEALRLIDESLESLTRAGLVETRSTVGPDTVLLGSGADLDSIGFVTFVSDLEDRIQGRTKQEHYLVLTEIAQFNIDSPALTADVLARYIEDLTGGAGGNG